jgi:hypothetical protein
VRGLTSPAVLRGRRGASRGGSRVCAGGDGVGVRRKAIQSLRPSLRSRAALRPSAEWYPTHDAKSAS